MNYTLERLKKKNQEVGIHHEELLVTRLDIMESGGSLELLSTFLSRILLSYIISYHLFSFRKFVQDYIVHTEIFIFVGIKG